MQIAVSWHVPRGRLTDAQAADTLAMPSEPNRAPSNVGTSERSLDLGAPAGHPFFGNQYTDGGYVDGSYVYDAVAGATVKAASKVGEAMPRVVSALRPKTSTPAGLSSTSIVSLIAAGTVVLIGGVATFVYLRSRSANAGDEPVEADNIAGFGLCESCGEELATSGPAVVEKDDDGEYIVCDRCSHKNRARTSEGEN